MTAVDDFKGNSISSTFVERSQNKADKSCCSQFCARMYALISYPIQRLQAIRKALSNMAVQDSTSLASLRDSHSLIQLETARAILFADQQNEGVTITTPDGAELDAIFQRGTVQKVVLFAVGRGGHYEELGLDGKETMRNFIRLFKEQLGNVSVLIPNIRGVGASTGLSTSATIPIDLQSCYKFLFKLGFQPDDVLTYGHSLGGLFGLKTAALIQEEYPQFKISVVVDRSMVDLSQLIESRSGKAAKILTKALFINVNTQKDAKSLKGHVIAYNSKADQTIPYVVSFVAQVAKHNIPRLQVVEMDDELGHDAVHVRKLSHREATQIGALMRTALNL